MALHGRLHTLERLITVTLFQLLRLVFTTIQSIYWELNGTAQKIRESRDPAHYERCAQVLDIVMFHTFCELSGTKFEEFLCTHNRFENPQFIIDNEDVSLLTINDKNAVFAQTKQKGMQVWKSEVSPFIRLSQMQHSKRLIVVPLCAFHRLAESIGDAPRIIFLFNTARCGSTLLNQVAECTGRCVAISEPDATNLVAFKYAHHGDTPEMRQLARDVIRWECRPFKSFQPPPLAYLLKLSAPCAVALEFFKSLYPDSICMFMYRDTIKVAKSIYRAGQVWPSLNLIYNLGKFSATAVKMTMDSMGYSGKDFSMRLADDLTFGVLVSAVCMKRYVDMRHQGFDVKAIRYEDLVARPLEACRELMKFWQFPVELAEKAVKGLEMDSQRNTPLAKSKIGHIKEPELTPESKVVANNLLRKFGLPLIGEECILEGTMACGK